MRGNDASSVKQFFLLNEALPASAIRRQDALNSFTVINALQDDKVPTPVAEVVVMEENVAKKDAQIDGRDEVIVSEDHEVIVLRDFE